ncbi:MAG TPA: DegT/DnrJ/EryC1/StrS family aminotransferase [Candidatus Nanoarchaeia archaeon]|nr:DegT/DnrJ/EryC1/StrS family aminotransferase [Candidatus Nanoarchaeia archaeon]
MQLPIRLMEDSFGEDEFKAVMDCLRSGQYTQGKLVEEFEQKFAQWNNSKYAVMVNSGSSANLLMVFMLNHKFGLQDGDEVIVPCVTWPTTIYPLIQYNLTPVLCEVDEGFNLDPDSLNRMISPKAKAVFLVHLLGQPAKIEEIKRICEKNNLLLIEDCCESLGAIYRGKKVGNFGKMGSFSFYFGHHMTTIEGGMIVTDDAEICDLLKSSRSHGWVRDSPRQHLYPQYENKNFLFDMLGYNLRSTNLNAAIGLAQLAKLDESIKIRIENNRYFLEKVKSLRLKFQQVNLAETTSFCFAILFGSKAERDYILRNISTKEIESRPMVAGNLLRQPVFQSFDVQKMRADRTPFADEIHDCGIYLPNNQFMTKEKIDYMLDSIQQMRKEFSLSGRT